MAVLTFPSLPANSIHFTPSREIEEIFTIEGAVSASATLIESHGRTGRPLGDKNFVEGLEARLGRPLAPMKRGRKPKAGT